MSGFAKRISGIAVITTLSGTAMAYPASVSMELELRAGPGAEHPVITVIPGGEVVEVSSCDASWCEVTYGAQRGFVSAAHLREIKASAPPVPLPPVSTQ